MKKQLILTRHKAREKAVQCLYMADSLNQWNRDTIELFCLAYVKTKYPSSMNQLENRFQFFKTLVETAFENKDYIDYWIEKVSIKRSLNNMARVDRNIIRLAMAEMLAFLDIPTNVTINEAIELSKTYGNIESPVFVNGITDKLAKLVKSGEASLKGASLFYQNRNIQLAS